MRKLHVVLPLLLLAFAACSTMPRTADLRIGMSRAEAIKVMGPPSSVSAQANFEYLNYTLSESMGIGMMNRAYYVRLVSGQVEAFGYMGQFSNPVTPILTTRPAPVSHATEATADGLKIINVEPASLDLGRENTVKVTLKYSLSSQEQANVQIGFNTRAPAGMVPRETRMVPKGAGEITFSTTVTPVDWGEMNDFKLTAILVLPGPPTGARALGSEIRTIPLKK